MLRGYLWLKSSCFNPPHPTPPDPSTGKDSRKPQCWSSLQSLQAAQHWEYPFFLQFNWSESPSLSDHWFLILQCRNPGDSNRVLSYKTCGHLLSFVYPTEAQRSLPSLLERMFQFRGNCPTRSNGDRGPNAHLYLCWSLYLLIYVYIYTHILLGFMEMAYTTGSSQSKSGLCRAI